MSNQARVSAVLDSVTRPARSVNWPTVSGKPLYPSDLFNQNVFTFATLSQTLPKAVYARFIEQIKVLISFFIISYFIRVISHWINLLLMLLLMLFVFGLKTSTYPYFIHLIYLEVLRISLIGFNLKLVRLLKNMIVS